MHSSRNTPISAEEPYIETCSDYPKRVKFGNENFLAELIALIIFAAITIMQNV